MALRRGRSPPGAVGGLLLAALLILYPCLTVKRSGRGAAEGTPLVNVSYSRPNQDSSARVACARSMVRTNKAPVLVSVAASDLVLASVTGQLSNVVLVKKKSVRPSCFGRSPVRRLKRISSLHSMCSVTLVHLTAQHGVPVFNVYQKRRLVGMTFNKALCRSVPARRPSAAIYRRRRRPDDVPARAIRLAPNSTVTSVAKRARLFAGARRRRTIGRITPKFDMAN